MPVQGPASLIKAQIKTNLDALVTAGTIGSVIELAINDNVLVNDFPSYPCAVLGSGNMQAQYEYQQTNRRSYTYNILIVQLQDNLSGVADMEDLRDAIALYFDNNVTLSGVAPFGIEAASSDIQYVADSGKNYVLFSVTIKAITPVDLTYNF